MSDGVETRERDMLGKTAIVTGASGGVGREIARALARRGADVILAVRSEERGIQAKAEIERDATGRVAILQVDMADLVSVRAFVGAVRRELDHVDVLVNNAGAWFTDRRVSVDGHELTFATNVLGPHLLTSLLEPELRASKVGARIVNIVSSMAGSYDADDLMFSTRKYDGFKAYAQSKQALRMLTWGQAARLARANVTSNAAAPGFVKTNFNQHARGFVPWMINLSASLFAVTADKGAETPVWVATAPALLGKTGTYFDALAEKDGKFRDVEAIVDLERRCDALIAGTATPATTSLRAATAAG